MRNSNFVEGSYVYVCGYGWGLFKNKTKGSTVCMAIVIDENTTVIINENGKFFGDQKLPVVFNYDPINGTEKPRITKKITYLGVEIPEPETEKPKVGSLYYSRSEICEIKERNWLNSKTDNELLSLGIWLDLEDAIEACSKIKSVMKIN